MDTVRFGVIGCGKMVRNHLNTARGKDPNTAEGLRPFAEKAEVRACCDVNMERAEECRQTYEAEYATDEGKRKFHYLGYMAEHSGNPCTCYAAALAAVHAIREVWG